MEGVHVGSAPQEPLIQNDQEDEVDARQEAEHHVRQQEGQVEALRGQEEGRAEPGARAGQAGREAASCPGAQGLMREGWQAWIKSQHPMGPQTLASGVRLLPPPS